MIETVAARVKKLEGARGAASEEPIKFRFFGIEALPDGTYARVNLASGNRKIMRADQLGIEVYQTKAVPQARQAGQGGARDALAVPVDAPEAVAEHVESEDERIMRVREQIARDFR